MDEHKEKEEDKFQESSQQQEPRKQEAEEEQEHNSVESMEQHHEAHTEGRNSEEAEETTVVQLKEVEAGSEEEGSPPPSVLGIFAHPCSLLQYLLQACADWFWGLHGAFDDAPKPQAVAPPEAVAPANSTEQGDGGGEKGNYSYMQEVVTRVWAVRRGPPRGGPGHPREGSGGNGGKHN